MVCDATEFERLRADLEQVRRSRDGWIEVNAESGKALIIMDAEIKRLQANGREAIVAWMGARGYATGHGDTIEDLLVELEGQAKERGTLSQVDCGLAADEIERLQAGLDEAVSFIRFHLPHAGADIVANLGKLSPAPR